MTRSLALSAILAVFAAAALAQAETPADEAKAKAKEADRLFAAAQEICPVTGMPLDSMGGPVKTKSNERTIYVCCKGCVGKPNKPQAWKQIQKNLAAAQGICPVLKKPLPEEPASTVIEGRTVFVCCKPCTRKVEAEPAKALAIVKRQLKEHAEKKERAEKGDPRRS